MVVGLLGEEGDLAVAAEDGVAIHTHTLLEVGMPSHLTSSRRRWGRRRDEECVSFLTGRVLAYRRDVAYSYTIFGLVHLPDSDHSCSFLSAGIGYHTTSMLLCQARTNHLNLPPFTLRPTSGNRLSG